MELPSSEELQTLFHLCIGQEMGAVTFVRDYFQLHFDGPTINVTSECTLRRPDDRALEQPDELFPGALRSLIGTTLSSVELSEPTWLLLHFGVAGTLRVHLPPDGREAIYFHDDDSRKWFVLP